MRESAIPRSWVGIPIMSRRTVFGAVRAPMRTRAAPPSARSTAISDPELPVPTTSTSRPAYGAGLRYSDEWTSGPSKRPGQSGTNGTLRSRDTQRPNGRGIGKPGRWDSHRIVWRWSRS